MWTLAEHAFFSDAPYLPGSTRFVILSGHVSKWCRSVNDGYASHTLLGACVLCLRLPDRTCKHRNVMYVCASRRIRSTCVCGCFVRRKVNGPTSARLWNDDELLRMLGKLSSVRVLRTYAFFECHSIRIIYLWFFIRAFDNTTKWMILLSAETLESCFCVCLCVRHGAWYWIIMNRSFGLEQLRSSIGYCDYWRCEDRYSFLMLLNVILFVMMAFTDRCNELISCNHVLISDYEFGWWWSLFTYVIE